MSKEGESPSLPGTASDVSRDRYQPEVRPGLTPPSSPTGFVVLNRSCYFSKPQFPYLDRGHLPPSLEGLGLSGLWKVLLLLDGDLLPLGMLSLPSPQRLMEAVSAVSPPSAAPALIPQRKRRGRKPARKEETSQGPDVTAPPH